MKKSWAATRVWTWKIIFPYSRTGGWNLPLWSSNGQMNSFVMCTVIWATLHLVHWCRPAIVRTLLNFLVEMQVVYTLKVPRGVHLLWKYCPWSGLDTGTLYEWAKGCKITTLLMCNIQPKCLGEVEHNRAWPPSNLLPLLFFPVACPQVYPWFGIAWWRTTWREIFWNSSDEKVGNMQYASEVSFQQLSNVLENHDIHLIYNKINLFSEIIHCSWLH